MKNFVRCVALVGFICSLAWIYFEPQKFDPWIAASAALLTLLSLFIPDTVRLLRGQSQQIGDGSTGIQAGGNVSISITSKKDSK